MVLCDHDYIRRNANFPDQPSEPDRLAESISELRLDYEEIHIAVGFLVPSCIRAEEDHLGIGTGSLGQCLSGTLDQIA